MFQKHIEHYSEQAIQYLAESVAESNDKVFIEKAMFDHVSCYDLEKDIYKKNRAIFSIFELPHKRFDIYIAVEDKCYVVTFEKIAKNEYVIIHSTEDGSV